MSSDLRRKLIYSLVFALLVYIGLTLWSDWRNLAAALVDFTWVLLPLAIGLTLVNYGGRLLRWHWYLELVGVEITRYDSARIFGVGMLMVMTPGKVGEFLKSYMVKNVTGTPMSVTAPIILAERMTDGMAMLVLASAGLFAFPNPTARIIATMTFLTFATVIVVIQVRPLALWFIEVGKLLPVVRRFAAHLSTLYESSYIIFQPRNFIIALAIGLVCWAAVGIAYFVVLVGFGVPASVSTALIAIFIFCISTVIGAFFALPGGLGGVEGSLVALSMQLLGLDLATATAAALLVRFCTLWMGVLFGVISILLWPELLAGSENARREPVAAAD